MKVFVTGCFDMLHSGHVAFLREAALHGELYVGIGSDETIYHLKGRYPINNQNERRFMLESLKYVHRCSINPGSGVMDFIGNPDAHVADILFVNEDGHSPDKEAFCLTHGKTYIVSKRIPHGDLPPRTTTALRVECNIPYRIDLAGGWLDQPYVSRHHSGSVVTICLEPTIEFHDRSGMASSTRRKAIELWHLDIPAGDREKLAKTLFCYENPPGTEIISGAQDALGIVYPGLNRHHYDGGYWPTRIESIVDEPILKFIEDHIYLVTLEPRAGSYSVLKDMRPDEEGARRLAEASDGCWQAILKKDAASFGRFFTASFEAQIAMFPSMVDEEILGLIERYRSIALGWKLSGAGGGGYLILISDKPIDKAIRIKIRRGDS